MELDEALERISEIRSHLVGAETFRGYRAATVAFSGCLGVGAAVVQAVALPEPVDQIASYLGLGIGAAALTVAVVGAELAVRCRAVGPRISRLTRLAVEQFLPCLVTGAVLTGVLLAAAPACLWLLPGLWAMVFGLGVFASCRLWPPAMFWIGVYYLVAGAACIFFAQGDSALSPWAMGATFGGGQGATAAVLYWTLERRHEAC